MTLFKTITQGGQVHIHQLVMLKQILVAGFIVAGVAGFGYVAYQCTLVPHHSWRSVYEVYWAKMMLATTPESQHKILTQEYTSQNGRPYRRTCESVLRDPLLLKTTHKVETYVVRTSWDSLKIAGYAFLATMGVWFGMGRYQLRARHERGNTIISWKHLQKLLKIKRKASDLQLSRLPFVKNKETSHFLITGTTGSGKTNAFHSLLPQIRKRGDKAVVLDVTGDYLSRYYDSSIDVLLNPFDQRSESWHPWADCYMGVHYDTLATSFIQPKEGSRDPFWDNASRIVFRTALKKFADKGLIDIEELYSFLIASNEKEFEEFFAGTEAGTFTLKNNERTTHSIRSVLNSQIECLRLLVASNKGFSIRKWMMQNSFEVLNGSERPSQTQCKQGWLFITARPDQRQSLTPLISTWTDIAINSLMALPEDPKRRIWILIDELAALQKLPSLHMGLAEGRKYGGCILVGFQSKPQLEDIYGRHAAEAMLDLFNTKIFFRSTEPSTQAWISKVLGDKEEKVVTENISYGSHHMRDGVSLSHHTRQKPLVLPTELGQLKDLECYVKLPGDWPVTKLLTIYQKK